MSASALDPVRSADCWGELVASVFICDVEAVSESKADGPGAEAAEEESIWAISISATSEEPLFDP